MTAFNQDSMFFTAFRQELSFPYYGPIHPQALALSNEVTLTLYFCGVVWLLMIISALGTRAQKGQVLLKNVTTLIVGTCIVLSISGGAWMTSGNQATGYEFGPVKKPNVMPVIRVDVALQYVNITLTIQDEATNERLAQFKHMIGWAGIMDAEADFQKALQQGYPVPVLKIAEYFAVDEGGLRYMRAFRLAGFVNTILLWASFAMWILANIVISMAVFRGAIIYMVVGVIQIIAVITYASLQPAGLSIPKYNGEAPIQLTYGVNFYLTMSSGIFTLIISGLTIGLAHYYPEKANKLFDVEEAIDVPFHDALLDELQDKPTPKVVKMFASIKRRSQAVSMRASRKHKVSHPTTIQESPVGIRLVEMETTESSSNGHQHKSESPKASPRNLAVPPTLQVNGSMESLSFDGSDMDENNLKLKRLNDPTFNEEESVGDAGSVAGTASDPGDESVHDDSVRDDQGDDSSSSSESPTGSTTDLRIDMPADAQEEQPTNVHQVSIEIDEPAQHQQQQQQQQQ